MRTCQHFYFLTDLRSAHASARFRSVELLRDEFPILAKDRVRFYDIRHVCQRLAAEPVADFGQRLSLRIGEPQAPLQLLHHNPVLHAKHWT